MAGFKTNTHTLAILISTILAYFLVSSVNGQNGQSNTPCTTSMITSFTPCMNFVTGSTSNGSSPSSDCCAALKALMSTSMDCTCLVMTANVPLPLNIINRTLALSLPRYCNTGGVPVQCKAAGAPLPAPGPQQFGSSPPPASAFSPKASKATASTPAAEPTATELPPVASPPVEAAAPTRTPGVRPVLTPSASSPSTICLPSIPFILIGFIVFKL